MDKEEIIKGMELAIDRLKKIRRPTIENGWCGLIGTPYGIVRFPYRKGQNMKGLKWIKDKINLYTK